MGNTKHASVRHENIHAIGFNYATARLDRSSCQVAIGQHFEKLAIDTGLSVG